MTDLAALCRAYAEHVGLPVPPDGFEPDVEFRLSRWPAWARLGARASAAAVRRLAPLALLGRPCSFEVLDESGKEALLARLQRSRWPPARGAFLMVKTLVLGSCYGLIPS